MEKKLKYPELEQDNYVAQVEAETAEAKKRAEQLEKQAKWDRDMALWGDMANLAAKGAAMHGGAWKINKDESAAAKGNERLRALQKENAAQLAAYAKQEVAARDAARKERNARAVAQYNAEVEAYKSAQAQANADRNFDEKKRHNEEMEKNYRAREQRLGAQGGSGSSVNRDVYLINDDGTKKVFKHADSPNNIRDAYVWLYTNYPEYAVMRNELVYEEGRRGAKVPKLDAKGNKAYELVIDKYPTEQEIKQKFAEFNARELKRQAVSDYNNRELIEDWTPEEDEIIDYEP